MWSTAASAHLLNSANSAPTRSFHSSPCLSAGISRLIQPGPPRVCSHCELLLSADGTRSFSTLLEVTPLLQIQTPTGEGTVSDISSLSLSLSPPLSHLVFVCVFVCVCCECKPSYLLAPVAHDLHANCMFVCVCVCVCVCVGCVCVSVCLCACLSVCLPVPFMRVGV